MAIGKNSITAIGEQSAKGTEAEAAKLMDLLATSNNMDSTVNYIKSEALTGNRFADESYPSSKASGGTIAVEVDDESLGLYLKHGVGEGNAVTDNMDSTYGHNYKPDQKVDKWLTVIKNLSDDGYYEKYLDCKINSLSIQATSQAIVTASLDLLGISSSEVSGAITTVKNTGKRLFAWETSVQIDGIAQDDFLDEFSCQHNNNLNGDDYGLKQERRSLDAQDSEHTFKMTMQFDKTTYMDLKTDLKAGNIVPIVVTIGALTITYPKAKLTEVSAPVQGGGKITVSVSGEALWDSATGTNVEFDLTNKVASY